ncbi:conserved hypothetical protein [Candidatus Nitrosymbiomonas proteolyticus]|uniref:Uncharacterized protein n=1 Tax=Candidatus Nitrosymbiomonas proteolyticus TaxID=2608984 RepID=A0A809SAZ9_9BACT|nr:conserved hypothetical protein [Candidatus Nitrosymbiomonas proteolyticus]
MAKKQPEAAVPAEPAKKRTRTTGAVGSPKYPYTISPGSLKKFLEQVPKKPKPPKVNLAQLKGWDIKDNNAPTIVKVLASVGVLGTDGVPTELYERLMKGGVGEKELAANIKSVYKEFFEAEHEPYKDEGTVTKLLHIHGGTEAKATIGRMRETFLILCRAADWSGASSAKDKSGPSKGKETTVRGADFEQNCELAGPSVVINIQVTLPSGADEKSYDAFFASMRKHLWPSK